jgi:hypothetical protein
MPQLPRTRRALARALHPPSLASGGLAFIIAYTLSYFVSALR